LVAGLATCAPQATVPSVGDARGGFVLTALDERDEFVPGGILH
jgi:hypothetical protein